MSLYVCVSVYRPLSLYVSLLECLNVCVSIYGLEACRRSTSVAIFRTGNCGDEAPQRAPLISLSAEEYTRPEIVSIRTVDISTFQRTMYMVVG